MIEEELYEHLQSLEIDIYPQVAKDNAKTPYLTYFLVTGRPREMPSGHISSTKSSWQIDIYESSSLRAKKLRESVVEKIRDFPLYSGNLSYRDGYEQRVKFFRQIIEFETKNNTEEC